MTGGSLMSAGQFVIVDVFTRGPGALHDSRWRSRRHGRFSAVARSLV